MAKKRAQTRLDSFAIAAGAALGRLAARIDNLTKRREAISAEIQRYVRQAEGVVRGLTTSTQAGRGRRSSKPATRRTSAARRRKVTTVKARTARSATRKK
jgi:hypothetical protein